MERAPSREEMLALPTTDVARTPLPMKGLALDETGKVPVKVIGRLPLLQAEASLGSAPNARYGGSFQITGLSGLGADYPVFMQQASGPYTGKGTRADEAEMDQVQVTAKVLNSTTIQCYWRSQRRVRGNFKFNYVLGEL